MTSTIQIVMAGAADPVGSGLIDSLPHPGGNITGLSQMIPDILATRLQPFQEAAPGITRVVCLEDPRVPFHAKTIASLIIAATSMGLTLRIVSVTTPDDIRQALSKLRSQRAQGLFVLDSPYFDANRKAILASAARHKMPLAAGPRSWIEKGALLTYSANIGDQFRRSAYFVDRIFKSAKPSKLPLEQPEFATLLTLACARIQSPSPVTHHPRTRGPRHRRAQVRRIGNDALPPRALHELDERLNLRPHAAAIELARRDQPLRLRERQRV